MDYAYPRWYNPDLGSRSRETEARYTQRAGEPQPPDLSVWPYQYPQSYTPFSYTAVPPGPGRVDFNEDHTFNTSASYDHVPTNPPFASMAQFGRPEMSMREAQWLSPPDVTAERPSWDGRNLRGSLGDLGSKRPFPLNPTSSSDPSSSSVKASDRPASDTSPPQPKSTTSNRPTPELKPSQTQGRGNFRSSPTLTKKLDELKSIEVEFRRLQSAYRPPRCPLLDKTRTNLAYDATNKPVHAYVDALEKLQGRLDAIATEDKVEVREKRRDVVRAIERELQRVDEWKRKVIRDADPSGRGSVSGSDRWNV